MTTIMYDACQDGKLDIYFRTSSTAKLARRSINSVYSVLMAKKQFLQLKLNKQMEN